MVMNLLFKKCNHHWVLTLERKLYPSFDELVHDIGGCSEYYMYCPKCGRRKKRLPEHKYKILMNEQYERENYLE